ncbi:hypothetical protein MKQ68_23560 [Chitinophaga horti]|uniref:PorZ N-terminal beta-propeller domain-containing protein n=1 Tax=Chitinophaga horti TaxID=2920382 RepID=A0ABY6J4C5_9BACT|nr:two-component regulator propeller domain-containing protein [Chitinophaga horti]UYQ93062.1 hypothetical protein MKQ68_23560 [Chitinophaga horti]
MAIGNVTAQTVPIGHWREHLPYRRVSALALSPDAVYCAAGNALFSANTNTREITRYNKLNGLHDVGISAIGYHEGTSTLAIGYKNGNIDLLRRENIINIPDLLRKQVNGDKSIYHIAFFQDNAYVCTGFGILVVDLKKQEIAATWLPAAAGNYVKVWAMTQNEGWFYAATSEGIRRAPVTGANLANYESWQPFNTGLQPWPVTDIAAIGSTMVALQDSLLFSASPAGWQSWGPTNKFRDISASGTQFIATGANNIQILTASGAIQTTLTPGGLPVQALTRNGETFIADSTKGLIIHRDNYETVTPNAPNDLVLGDLLIVNNTLWASAGAVTGNWAATRNKGGLFHFEQEEWTNYTDVPEDIIALAYTPQDNTLWAGSFGSGVLILPKGEIFKAPQLDAAIDNLNAYRVGGAATDAAGNLWLSNYGANRNLALRKKDGSWQNFTTPYFLPSYALSQIVIDDFGQKWIVAPKGGGLIVYNHGSNIDLPADDKWAIYQTGTGRGNLPSADVRCIAKDKSGYIWVGTTRGVGVIQCPQQAITAAGCDAYLPVLQEGNFAGYLFRNEQVNTIAVDGADRKWVGTQNGVWLISSAGDKIIHHFNIENSPLLSNEVRKIAVHPQTGEVFFATTAGLLSFRGTATGGGDTHKAQDVLVFPNPVPPGHTGPVAIRGLVTNALVKITDISGRLVYQGRAQGGQAVWNGQDYTGHRPQSGVYLVFSSDDTGTEKLVTKIVFIH